MEAVANSWKREPFGEIAAIPYACQFSTAELVLLREGLIPRAMEDKWFIYFEEPFLNLHRSWTGLGVYRVELVVGAAGASVKEALCSIDQIERSSAAYQAELLDFLIGNLLLHADRPFPAEQSLSSEANGLMQHAVSGTGYPSAVVRKP